ncbi:hypothetical protein JCM6882_003788 [Rhodosporidiobolus microsporus]
MSLVRPARALVRSSLRQRPSARSPTALFARGIANNQVAPQFLFQNASQLDLTSEARQEHGEGGPAGAGGAGGPDGPDGKKGGGGGGGGPGGFRAAFESVLATGAGIGLLAGAGLCYHYWYKVEVLRKMDRAFQPGYDPVLELATAASRESDGRVKPGRVRRKEQDYIDKLINGEITGEYLLMMGPKGVGKTSMLMDAMIKNAADGCAMLEAHEDPEVFRLRLGKALDFEFHEDSFAGLFQRREPREAGPVLDIERALAKLEKAAIAFRRRRNRPMVMIIQNAHFIHDDEDGHSLLHMLQQRAEAWSQAGVLTMIFLTDNFNVYRHLKRSATRMHTLSIRDLTPSETFTYLSGTHARFFPDEPPVSRGESLRIWDLIGGRLSFLSKVVKRPDMLEAAQDLVQEEKEWLHSRLPMIPDHDDDVMDQQKEASCSFLLFQHFAKQSEASEPRLLQSIEKLARTEAHDVEEVEEALELDMLNALPEDLDPKVTYREACEIMTRADYAVDLDAWHIINIDRFHNVRPDSRLMLSAFKEVAREEDFQEKLDNVRDRVDAIESLHRTRELTVKTGDGDLGGFLRLRIGDLLPQHEKIEEEDEGADEGPVVAGEGDKGRAV